MEALGPDGPMPTRAPLAAAVVCGAVTVAALPLSLALGLQWSLLTAAAPVAVVLLGQARRLAWLQQIGVGLMVVLAVGVFLIGAIVVAFVALGPIVMVALLGPALRQHDAVASAAFLTSAVIAIIAGFAAAPTSPSGAALLVTVVLGAGTVTAVTRLTRG
jgi:hypothetical protein